MEQTIENTDAKNWRKVWNKYQQSLATWQKLIQVILKKRIYESNTLLGFKLHIPHKLENYIPYVYLRPLKGSLEP